jgi:hypothetical protein
MKRRLIAAVSAALFLVATFPAAALANTVAETPEPSSIPIWVVPAGLACLAGAAVALVYSRRRRR